MIENLFKYNTLLVFRPGTITKGSPEGRIVVFNKMCHNIHLKIMNFVTNVKKSVPGSYRSHPYGVTFKDKVLGLDKSYIKLP